MAGRDPYYRRDRLVDICFDVGVRGYVRYVSSVFRTRTRTNTNPNDTEANAAGRSVRACVARKSKS